MDSKQPFIQKKNNRLKKRLIFQPSESSLCADKLIVLRSLNSEALFGLPGHMHFITLHLGDKGSLGVKMNTGMSQGFGLSSVTQTLTSHWS